MSDDAQSYAAIRTGAVWYERHSVATVLRGEHRHAVLAALTAKRTEYTEVGSVLESLVLRQDGMVLDLITVFPRADDVLLLGSADLSEAIGEAAAIAGATRFAWEDVSASHPVIAVEGPASWRVADEYTDDDIATVLLNETRPATAAATTAVPASSMVLARVGTTAEYGYLLIAADCDPAVLRADVRGRVEAIGGGAATPAALERARAEVSHPLVPAQFDGLTVRQAGVRWLTSPDREDDYLGRAALLAQEAGSTLVAVTSEQEIEPGAAITAAGEPCGRVHLVVPRVGQERAFALALLEPPFAVPGLVLDAGGATLTTVSRPAVDPRSWVEAMA